MHSNKSFLAIIPARGGSKRLPRKNVLALAGKPLIAWSIEAARQSQYIDSTLVSSDDQEILAIAKTHGSDILERPPELASDTSSSFDAIEHAIASSPQPFDYVVLLQPTSPMRTAKHLDEAISRLIEKEADAVISVCEMEHSPLWANTLPEDGAMDDFLRTELKNKRSQDLPTHYRLNGAIYICKTDRLLEEKSFFIKDRIYSYVMTAEDSVDIDTLHDFEYARWAMSNANKNQ